MLLLLATALLVAMAFPAAAATTHKGKKGHHGGNGVSVSVAPYGTLADGTAIEEYTLTNKKGMTVKIITYGGIVTELHVPDKQRQASPTSSSASTTSTDYLAGQPVLRRASPAATPTASPRASSRSTARSTRSPRTTAPTTCTAAWRASTRWCGRPSRCSSRATAPASKLTYTSPDGEEGYPGTLQTHRHLHADERQRAADRLPRHDRQADARQPDQPHATSTSAGDGSGHPRTTCCRSRRDKYTPVDDDADPDRRDRAGRGHAVRLHDADTPSASASRRSIRRSRPGQGYDHNFVLDGQRDDTSLQLVATVDGSGERPRAWRVLTTEPGVQFYTGNFLDGTLVGPRRGDVPPGRRVLPRDPALSRTRRTSRTSRRWCCARVAPTRPPPSTP